MAALFRQFALFEIFRRPPGGAAGGEAPAETYHLLMESGDALLLESGDHILLEEAA